MIKAVRFAMCVALLASAPAGRACAQGTARSTDLRRPASADSARSHSNIRPALEIVGFLTALNLFNRVAFANLTENGVKVFSSTPKTTWDNLRIQRWEHDQDAFTTNQFGHPYQGSLMFGLARSSGHGFWTSAIHANIGSFLWEMAGEALPPSVPDLITTSQAGSLFGEVLYRLSDLVLNDGGGATPDRFHDVASTLIAPAVAFNRRAFGDRFSASRQRLLPATVWQVKIGATLDAIARDYAAPTTLLRKDATAEFTMSYGLPGQPGYTYRHPLDYFDFQLSVLANAKNPIEHLMIRGLLLGAPTAPTRDGDGIWGLYGSYDYFSPYLFRVSSTALSLGTTRQYTVRPGFVLQGSALGGIGYGAAGSTTIIASTPTNAAIRDYHFGVTPQALLALRVIGGTRAQLDFAAREYFVSGTGSDDRRGSETIFRGSMGLTVRVRGGQALGAQYVASLRHAQYGAQPNVRMTEGTVTLSYSIVGGKGLSVGNWK